MTRRFVTTQLTIGLICAVASIAQVGSHQSTNPNKQPPKPPAVAAPVHTLDFQLKALITGVKASPALTLPFQCSLNGDVLVTMLNPMRGGEAGETSLVDVRGDRGNALDVSAVRDVAVESVVQPFFSGASPALFVYGRHKVGSSTEKAPRASYVLLFGPEGQYQKSVELKSSQIVLSVAALPSGDFLVAGHDDVNRQDTLAIFRSDGTIERPLDQPMTARERNDGYQQGNPTTFANHGSSVVAYRLGTRNAVLEVGPKNTVREIPLALPPGAVISDMVSSDDSLIVYSLPESKAGEAVDSASGIYYEMDHWTVA